MVNEPDSSTGIDARFVDARIAALDGAIPGGWTPNANAGRKRLDARRARSRRAFLASGITVASGAAMMTIPAARAFAGRCVDACIAQSSALLGTNVDALPPSALAPDFTLTAADGSLMRLSELRGKVVLLNFWAPWCRPCLTEMPWFSEMQQAYGERGLVVLGVSVEPNARAEVKYRLADDTSDGAVAAKYKVEALPATFLIDRRGAIAKSHAGLVSREVYEAELKELLDTTGRAG